MANILLPLSTTFLALGLTVDITTYDFNFYLDRENFIFNKTNYVVTRPGILKSTYYVLPVENVSYSSMNLPIDLALRIKLGTYSKGNIDGMSDQLDYRDGFPALYVVTEYVEAIKSLKETAVPFADWKNSTPLTDTHYVESFQYGIKSTGLYRVWTAVPGDAEVARRILLENMGDSGPVTNNTLGTWKKALAKINEIARGRVLVGFLSQSTQGSLDMVFADEEDMLGNPSKIVNKVKPYDPEKNVQPLSVNLRSLHDLDKEYPEMVKNSETEEYLEKLNKVIVDLTYTFLKTPTSSALESFNKDVMERLFSIKSLKYGDISLYKNVNKTVFNEAFEIYESGLSNDVGSYQKKLKKLYEDTAIRCKNTFLKPTKGLLEVADNEVIMKNLIEGGLKECQEYCLKDDKCRAVSYAETKETAPLFSGLGNSCWIYYRSTNTAPINAKQVYSVDVELYDRQCT